MKQRHKGRASLGVPLMIACEECGANWTAPQRVLEAVMAVLALPVEPEPELPGYRRTPVHRHARTPAPIAA